MIKFLKFSFVTLLFLGFVACVSVITYAFNDFNHSSNVTQQTIVDIPKGSSFSQISKLLKKSNVVANKEIFEILAKYYKLDKGLKAGEYSFKAGVTPKKAIKQISDGTGYHLRKITIAEGLTTHQVLQIIKKNQYFDGKITINVGEGELLPETYVFTKGKQRNAIIKEMQNAMQATLNKLWKNKQANLPIKSKKEAIILASIVEKETGIAGERRRVAGVFVNRLNKKMRLQSDPTTIYALTLGKKDLGRPLLRSDWKVKSPYNTYYIKGLPKSPIANPGTEAIKAVLNPIKTDEIYFVADGTGGHKFAKTLKEHNKNVQNWRKINKK